tara:strand:- start:871 stop:1065 length:195 start_codon:yes stop_codon:yes gene_type:complete
MKEINKEQLYTIYREKFGVEDYAFCSLRKEFNQMMLLKYEMMPYWFICELIDLGIEINDNEELF